MLKTNQKRWTIGLVIVILVAGFFIFKDLQRSQRIQATQQEKQVQYQGESGKTVFGLLTEKHDVGFTQSDLGVFVISIDGLENSEIEFWIYYVDNQMGTVAADKFETKDDQEIEWKYEVLAY